MKKYLCALLISATSIGLATAAENPASHSNHTTVQSDMSPSSKAYEVANDKMHKDMAIQFSGNSDVDFVRGMIPHHQGAIDMAKVVLQYGKDAEIRKLAQGVIKAQTEEIAMMNAWLAKNAPKNVK